MIERYAEEIIRREMKIQPGKNGFGYVFVQGESCPVEAINHALKRAGGKPKVCELSEYRRGSSKKGAMPEYIITFERDLGTLIIVECKRSVKQHESEHRNQPAKYAVDGVLYYAKYLKDSFNVIAVAQSGTDKSRMSVSTFYWERGQSDFLEYEKLSDILLEPENYLKFTHGENIQKAYNLEDIQATAVEMHDSLRVNKMTEKLKPLFVAGILLALQDDSFCADYDKFTSFSSLLDSCGSAIRRTLDDGEIGQKKIDEICSKFKEIDSVIKLKETPLLHSYSLRWYIRELEMKVKPMMDYIGNTIDAMGVFYHEFISYSSGDGNSLGIVLTPQHLTEFMSELIDVDKKSKVIDICCGSGAFLVTAMGTMFKQAVTPDDIEDIRKNNLFGIEQDSDIHTLALANMIMRKDGKSHILHGDCFNDDTVKLLKDMKDTNGERIVFNKGLLNPPYSQRDHSELEFVERELELLCPGGELAVVCPVSCAIGKKFQTERKRLMDRHTLKAVFSMPDDIFYGNNSTVSVCVMVWEAWKKHDKTLSVFFGYYKEDGFVKRKHLGRVDTHQRWNGIKKEWLNLYREREVREGISAKAAVSEKDEWLCEAYMKTDYGKLNQEDFQQTLNDYLSYLVRWGKADLGQAGQQHESIPLKDAEEWGEFQIQELFEIFKGKRLVKADMIEGDVNYLGAISSNNGVRQKIETDESWKPNCITVNYNGSVGEAYYQSEPFWASDDVNVLYAKGWEMEPFLGLFLSTIIKANRYRFSYGRKWTKEKMEETYLKLPQTDEGKPDFSYMRSYMESLRYSERI